MKKVTSRDGTSIVFERTGKGPAVVVVGGILGDRSMVELFFTKAVGLPIEFVAQMRQAPFWPAQEALAHTLIYNAMIMGDFSLPAKQVATVNIPILVIDGGETLWLSHAAQAVAEVLANAQRRTLKGQPHNVAPETLAPVLVEFFKE